jgi:hypothetical protein
MFLVSSIPIVFRHAQALIRVILPRQQILSLELLERRG